jgi:predicted nucleic acid binding AN1-type Zn finger protein
MGIREKIRDFLLVFSPKKKYPVHAICSACGEDAYLPFSCSYCGHYFCGKHHLPFNHDCKNIDAWRNQPASSGKK